jgi:hypothetical protein
MNHPSRVGQKKKLESMYSRTPLIRINWNGETFGYAEIRIIGCFFEIGHVGKIK